MTEETKELLNNLIDAIKIADYDELVRCFKKQINYFKLEMKETINSIDPVHYYQVGQILRDLQTRVELIIKLSDFIDYVGVLQGTIIEEK
jgi:hypothetical protein